MMAPRPTSPVMNSVCGGGRESSVSPPSVVAPLAIKPPTLNDSQALPVPADQQQRLLYQLALAERLRLASAGLAWARPPLLTHQHHSLQESSAGSLMGGNFMNGLGFPVLGGLGSVAFGGGMIGAAASQIPSAAYPPSHPLYGYRLLDPRMLLPRGPEEPKPQHSYIGLIAMAILSSPEKKLILSDIYQYILDNYPYFRTRGTGWRNSIRHNLSLNDCFMKSGRSANGKGHYWAIHPANIDDFRRGDFRRRRAQRRVRKHMGLAVDDDSEPETLSPPPPPVVPTCHDISALPSIPRLPTTTEVGKHVTRPKRQFDVLSLLAPDTPRHHLSKTSLENSSDDASSMEVSSADILGQSKINLPSDPLVRIDDDLRLQLREVSADSLSHHLSLKATCLPRNDSDSVRCGDNEDSSIRAHDEEVEEDEEELVKVEEEEEEKYLPIFQANQRKIASSAVGGPTGDLGGCAPPATREISSPLEYLSAPWHSPTSPLAVPVSNTEVHYTNPLPIITSSGSPPQQYTHEMGNSPIRNFPSTIASSLGNKPILTPSTSSPFHFSHSVAQNHGHPTLSTSHINLSNYTSVIPRTSQVSSTSSSTHPLSVPLPQGTEIHPEP